MVKDILTAQAKERQKRTQPEKELSTKEEAREKCAEDREQKFMDSMTSMMSVMSQFMGIMMYGFPSAEPTYPSLSTPMNIPLPQHHSQQAIPCTHKWDTAQPATSATPPCPVPTQESDDDDH